MKTRNKAFSQNLLEDPHPFSEDQYPPVTVIIPAHNCAPLMGLTLSSLMDQDYPHLEIIVIDAQSQDRTLEVAKSYRHDSLRIYSVSEFNRYEMINKGITLATGDYLSVLFPGDSYVSSDTLNLLMNLALSNDFPDLLYCGCLLRGAKAEVKLLHRPLTLSLLKRGQQPTCLQACWFKPSVFDAIGKFNRNYIMRGGFEFLCRYQLHKKFRTIFTTRILVDYHLAQITKTSVLNHFIDTGKTVWRFFGFLSVIKWLFFQHDIRRWFKMWFNSITVAFSGRQT
ncbi:MAG: glycosyltransferase [Chlamydiia bacterium]|nr:glycosyltransferase [Chlamydiia bacterium]